MSAGTAAERGIGPCESAESRPGVAFLPLNPNHVTIFANIITHLSVPAEVWCNDRIAESSIYHTERTLQQLGLPYRHFSREVPRAPGESVLRRLANHRRLAVAIRSMLRETRPRLLVLALDNDPISQICVRECSQQGIRTALVPEGLLKPYEFKEQQRHGSSRVYAGLRGWGLHLDYIQYGQAGCDFIFVSGRRSLKILQEAGVDRERMLAVGQQRYDTFVQRVRGRTQAAKRTKVMLYAGSTRICSEPGEIELVRVAVRSAVDLGYRMIIKMHPRDSCGEDRLRELLGSPGEEVQILRSGYETYDILDSVDLVLTISSAIVLEALMMDKECLVATYLAGRRRMEYGEYDALFEIESKEQIKEQMVAAVSRKKPRASKERLLTEELGALDGQAGRRTAGILETVLACDCASMKELKRALAGAPRG